MLHPGIQTHRISVKNTPLRVVFSNLFSVLKISDETLSLVFDTLLNRLQIVVSMGPRLEFSAKYRVLILKVLANEDTLFPRLPARNICCGHKFCVRDTKYVSDFVQKHFVSATNVSQFAQAKKHHEQQCVRNNVPSFASTFTVYILGKCSS